MTALIFDVANVIVDWDPMRALAGAVPDEVANDFLAAEVFWELNARTDAGMPLADAVVEMDDQAPHLVDVYRVYLERFPLTVSGPIAGTAEVIRERMARAKEESAYMKEYDYVVINDDLDECVENVHQLIRCIPACGIDLIGNGK